MNMNQIDGFYVSHRYHACMEIHQLRALDAIATEGSFLAAAVRLDLSQSSLSHAIASLERELGARLFERGRYGARPTDAGRRILPYARQILTSLEAITSEINDSAGLLSGRVRVGSIPSATVAFLPKAIARFAHAHPNVEVVLLEEPSQSTQPLAEWLQAQMVDGALVQVPAAGMKTVTLMHDELCALLPIGSQFASRRQISLRDLAGEPFIMSRYTSELLLHAAYARHELAPRVRFEVQDLGTLVSMVREGLGYSVVPRIAFPAALPGVVLLPVTPRIRRELGFAIRDREHAPPALRAFVRAVEETAAKQERRRVPRARQ
jgi:DNA-binding transcriptional LysR family regulator